jgi:hypothetical protein
MRRGQCMAKAMHVEGVSTMAGMGRQQMEKEKRKRHTRVLQRHATRVMRQDEVRAMHQGGATREEGATRRRHDATGATRDEGVGTRGHVHGREGKGQQMKKKKRKRLNRWLQRRATRAMR